jgi:predicted nucleic acid-binding protein
MILDTNAISALAEQDKVLTDLVQAAPRVTVTIISLGEYAFGISQSRHRVELEAWLDALLLKVDVLLFGAENTSILRGSARTAQSGWHPDPGK